MRSGLHARAFGLPGGGTEADLPDPDNTRGPGRLEPPRWLRDSRAICLHRPARPSYPQPHEITGANACAWPSSAYDQLTPEQKAAWDEVVAGPRRRCTAPSSSGCTVLSSLEPRREARPLRQIPESSLPQRLSELCILMMAAHWKAAAPANGSITPRLRATWAWRGTTLEALRKGQPARFSKRGRDRRLRPAQELLNKRDVSDATYARVKAAPGRAGHPRSHRRARRLRPHRHQHEDVRPEPDAAADPFSGWTPFPKPRASSPHACAAAERADERARAAATTPGGVAAFLHDQRRQAELAVELADAGRRRRWRRRAWRADRRGARPSPPTARAPRCRAP